MPLNRISIIDGEAEGARPWTVEAQADVAGARIEMRRYRLESPSEMYECDAAPILSSTLPRREGMRGQLRFEVGDRRRQQIGPLMLRPAGIPMLSQGDGGTLDIFICRFDAGAFLAVTGLDEWDAPALRRCADLRSRPLSAVVRRLRAEVLTPGLAATTALEALVRLALVEIARAFRTVRRGDLAPGGLARWQLVRIEEALRSAEGQWPDTRALAALCGLSRSHLSRAFARSTGSTLAAHAAAIRLERALTMTAEGALPMARIAELLGFASASAFGAAFRRATGEPPARYGREKRAG